MLDTPILFLVFNRPEVTARVFATIREARPTRLFVAADGPRADRAGEAALCEKTRQLATAVDWPCTVTTLFHSENRGCGRAVSEAITWFFEHVQEGIILEDDCLPHPDFFPFCAAMLSRYRDNPRVLTISGDHFLPRGFDTQASHYFSKYVQIWGWATWRRTWQAYDFSLSSIPEGDWQKIIQTTCPLRIESGYWSEVFRALRAGGIDTWDFQLLFSCWKQTGLHVVPRHNLISNLGYGPDATHTNFTGILAGQDVRGVPPPYADSPMVVADSDTDGFIFYARFLEHLSQSWWVEQVLSPERKLGEARAELSRKDRYIRELEREVREKRRQLLAATRTIAALNDIS
ncbi:MAG: hypothetical protein QM691_08610 [Opitutaceae bacterium]